MYSRETDTNNDRALDLFHSRAEQHRAEGRCGFSWVGTMILGQDFLRKSIGVTLCSLLGSLVTLLLLGRKCQALKSRNLRGAGRE